MAQCLRALAALAEDWDLITSTHMTDNSQQSNSSPKGSIALFWLPWASHGAHGAWTYM